MNTELFREGAAFMDPGFRRDDDQAGKSAYPRRVIPSTHSR
jgi:hypothetical protein